MQRRRPTHRLGVFEAESSKARSYVRGLQLSAPGTHRRLSLEHPPALREGAPSRELLFQIEIHFIGPVLDFLLECRLVVVLGGK